MLSFDYLSSGFPGQSFFVGQFNDTFSYATTGPVFNLPAGYTVNGDGIVDNRFVGGDPATSVPEPAGILLVALALLVLFVARSAIQVKRQV